MVADTYDPVLGLILQGTGNNNNSWGASLNNSMIKLVARGVAGIISRAVTGGSLDLSTPASNPPNTVSQAIDHIQYFVGALTSSQTVIMPAISGDWLFVNATTGAFQLLVKTPAQATPTQVPQGTTKYLWCDGTNMFRTDISQVGEITMNGISGIPAGQLWCNGASYLRADYPDLFARIGTTWGSADGTHFTLPDFYTGSRFPRAAGTVMGVTAAGNSANLSHTHAVSSATTGVEQQAHNHDMSFTTGTSNQSLNHSHVYTSPGNANSSTGGGGFTLYSCGNAQFAANSNNTDLSGHNHSLNQSTGNEQQNHNHLYSFTTGAGSADTTEARPNFLTVYFGIRI